MSFFAAYNTAYDTAKGVKDQKLAEARTELQDRTNAATRLERMKQAEANRKLPPDEFGLGAPEVQYTPATSATPASVDTQQQQAARLYQLRTQQPEDANQSDAETRRLTRNPEVPQVVDKGNLRLRTPGSWAPLPMTQEQRLAEMRKLNPVAPRADQTPAEDARLARQAPVGQASVSPLSPEFFARQRMVESRNNPNAVSPKGAVGTMQTMPTTLTNPGFGVVPARDNSPAELQRVGEDYMRAMHQKYNGNMQLALMAYNWGPGNVDKWIAAGSPPNAVPAETRNYVAMLAGGQPTQQAAAPAQAPQVGAQPQAAAQPQYTGPRYSDAQVAQQIQQGYQRAAWQMDRIKELAQVTSDPKDLLELRGQYMQLQSQVREAQLYEAFSRGQLSQDQYRMLSLQEQQRAAAEAAEWRKARITAEGAAYVEGVKGAETRTTEEMKGNQAIYKAIQERQLTADDVQGVNIDRNSGKVIVHTKRGVFEATTPDLGNGVKGVPRLVPYVASAG